MKEIISKILLSLIIIFLLGGAITRQMDWYNLQMQSVADMHIVLHLLSKNEFDANLKNELIIMLDQHEKWFDNTFLIHKYDINVIAVKVLLVHVLIAKNYGE